MDKEMVDAMRALLDERDERLSQMMDAKLEPMKAEMTGTKAEMAGMKAEMAGMKAEMAGTKADLAAVKHKQDEQAEFERETRVLIENVNKNLRLLAEGHGIHAAKLQNLDRIEMTLNDVKSDTEVIKNVVMWHSEAIDRLKKAK